MTIVLATEVALVVLCALVSALSQGRWSNPWAAVVLPAVLVITAAQLSAAGLLVVSGIFAVATGVSWAGVLPAPVGTLISNAVGSGVVVGAALAASHLVVNRAPLAAPVVMALVIAGSEALGSRVSPFGEWGSLAHTQARRSWALVFARGGPRLVTATLVLVSSALGFAATQRSTTLLILGLAAVAGLTAIGGTTNDLARSAGARAVGILEDDEQYFTAHVRQFVATTATTDEWWSSFREASSRQQQRLLHTTRSAGLEGADLVVWSEGAGLVATADHPLALDATAEVARSTSTYVVASWMVLDRSNATMDNVCTVFDATGRIVLTCAKRFPVPGPETNRTTVRQQDSPTAVDTPFGRLAVMICFDADHAESWRLVVRSGAEVVAVPASDWPAIGRLHADMALLRARSAGVALVRPARGGVSTTATARGHVTGRQDHRHANTPALRGTI